MTDRTDLDLDAPVMTRREALQQAHERLTSVVCYCLNAGLEPDAMDKESIREAFRMVTIAMRRNPDRTPAEAVYRTADAMHEGDAA